MTVEQLVEKLYTLDPGADVLIYIDEAEDYGSCDKVELFTPERQKDLPYAKGDVPKLKKPTVLISGWVM